MSRREQIEYLTHNAQKAFGKDLGQIIVGKKHVYVHVLSRREPVVHVEHEKYALEAAVEAVRTLMQHELNEDVEAKDFEVSVVIPACATNDDVPHEWQESSRDVGANHGPSSITQRCMKCREERSFEADTLAEVLELTRDP